MSRIRTALGRDAGGAIAVALISGTVFLIGLLTLLSTMITSSEATAHASAVRGVAMMAGAVIGAIVIPVVIARTTGQRNS